MPASPRARLLALAAAALLWLSVLSPAQGTPPRYDLFLRGDAGRITVWIDTATGDFRWVDPKKSIDLSARGTLAFPNLGPMVLWYAGEVPGHDWALVALKVYGNTATGSLTLFPTGEKAKRVVSMFHDRDTRDDGRTGAVAPPRPAVPEIGEIHTAPPPEVQATSPPAP